VIQRTHQTLNQESNPGTDQDRQGPVSGGEDQHRVQRLVSQLGQKNEHEAGDQGGQVRHRGGERQSIGSPLLDGCGRMPEDGGCRRSFSH
jgi:hypothetical protein